MRTFVLLLAVAGTALSVPSCGQTPIKPDLTQGERIVGGTVATPYSWPWNVALCSVGWGQGCSLECGASIIDNNWVMTAAQCVYQDATPSSYNIKAGFFKYTADSEDGSATVNLKAIFMHPKFDPNLATPLTYSDHIQPVCLPSDDSKAILPPNQAWTTGWGTTSEDGDLSEQLRQVDVPFVDFKTCETEYDSIQEDNMVCAGRKGVDACIGDAGGPLVTQGASGTWFQVGLVSYGVGCAEDHEPGVYSRVQAYCDFIKSTTNSKAQCQPIV